LRVRLEIVRTRLVEAREPAVAAEVRVCPCEGAAVAVTVEGSRRTFLVVSLSTGHRRCARIWEFQWQALAVAYRVVEGGHESAVLYDDKDRSLLPYVDEVVPEKAV